jgi:two-component system response regulator (stage 0 sporulation protein A)
VKIDDVLLELGHSDNLLGTEYIRTGVALYERGVSMTKELYPAIAKAYATTPSRVERAMRHSIEKAWERGSFEVQTRYFGYSVDPETGRPRVGEYLARLARICREN